MLLAGEADVLIPWQFQIVPGRMGMLVTLFLSLTALLVSTISSSPEVNNPRAENVELIETNSAIALGLYSMCDKWTNIFDNH